MFVLLGVRNEDIVSIAYTKDFAMNWVNQYVKPYLEIIIMIAVGHDINPGDELAKHLLPAMEALYQGLKRIDLWYINVVTPLQLSWLQVSHPPSAGQFVEQNLLTIRPIIKFMMEHINYRVKPSHKIILCDLYPYYASMNDPAYSNISLDYALLINSSNVIVQDGDIGYTNLLDGLVDDFISAIEKIGLFNDQGLIYIGATGWPITSGRRDDD